MYICLCNPFSDRDVKACLSEQDGKAASVAQVYKSCSGGVGPCCGSCVPTLKDMVRDHNGKAAVRAISDSVNAVQPAETA